MLHGTKKCLLDDGYKLQLWDNSVQFINYRGHIDCELGHVPILYLCNPFFSLGDIKNDTLFEGTDPYHIEKWSKDTLLITQFERKNTVYYMISTHLEEDPKAITVWDNEPLSEHYKYGE